MAMIATEQATTDEKVANCANGLGTRSIFGYQKPDDIQHHHFFSSEDDNVINRVESNDLSVAWLKIHRVDNDEETTQKIGRAIANSIYLRRVDMYCSMRRSISRDRALLMFNPLAKNRSIEFLHIDRYNFRVLDIFQVLQPLIEQNRNFCGFEISCCTNLPVSSLKSLLLKSQTSHLKHIDLNGNLIGDKDVADFIHTLNAMPSLRHLLDLNLNKNKVGMKGCTALAVLLENPACRIHYVAIGENNINDECLDIVLSALVKNKSLKTLDLDRQGFLTPKGWQKLTTFLTNPMCSIENLMLGVNNMKDESFISLGDALVSSITLKSLHIDEESEITPKEWQGYSLCTPNGWHGFSKCLTHPDCALEELSLIYSTMDDTSAITLFAALASNTSLKALRISILLEDLITPDGWIACFELLVDSKCVLEELDVSQTNIDDRGILTLVNLLSRHMSTVRSLNSGVLFSVSEEGWMPFVRLLLPDSTSKLEKLIIGDDYENEMNETVMDGLVSALRNNTNLRVLNVGQADISTRFLEQLYDVLSNRSSIDSVWNSNHTLTEFSCRCDISFPDEIDYLLEINHNEDKSEVVRTKLLDFFSESDTHSISRIFDSAAMSVIPHVIEWIGRDDQGFPEMYNLCQSIPWLFEVQTDAPVLEPCSEAHGSQNSVGATPPRKLRKLD